MGLFAAFCVLIALVVLSDGSSHSESPSTASSPRSDLSDFYAFNSYEPGRAGFVTFIANINGLQETQNGPNYSPIASDFVYNIHVENTGDGVEDLTFQFVPGARYAGPTDPNKGIGAGISIPVPHKGTAIKQTKAALVNLGQVKLNGATGVFDESSLNYVEHYVLRVVSGPVGKSNTVDNGPFASNANGGGTEFRIPFSYAGTKTFPGTNVGVDDYTAYANQFVYSVNLPGCSTPAKVFVGQRQESFVIALGKIFDLVNMDPTAAGQSDAENSLQRKAITSFCIEVASSCLVGPQTNGVIGSWASVQHLGHVGASHTHVAGAQKNRLGQPLVNELLIGLTDKDQWNAEHPRNEVNYLQYYQYPSLPEIVDILFNTNPATNFAPNLYPRVDLATVLLQGVPVVAALGGYTTQQQYFSSNCGTVSAPPMADMIRLNTKIAATPQATQSPFGILGSDIGGFPNGRRPGDDVVDMYLRLAMGALCWPPFDTALGICNSTAAPIGNVALTDHAPVNASYFLNAFPYLGIPAPGSIDRCP